jgi:cephalosporin-C deacetylase-like acetyl esterase
MRIHVVCCLLPITLLLNSLLIPATAAAVPQTLTELWADFPALDRTTPLQLEILKEWEQDGVTCRVVRYQVGIFKDAPSRVAAFYALPKTTGKHPAIIDIHGGGQSASLNTAISFAKRGYACLSLNWGGNKMSLGQDTWTGPQTEWGNLDATHPPQRNPHNHFAGPLAPDEFTLDSVESPRNSNWFLVLTAARRAISLLEQQPEIDSARIGARGHSMGGKLTTNLAGIDPRIKAAVPSCGGSGDLTDADAHVPGGSRTKRTALELACVSDNAYLPKITCPILWLSPTNDFHAHIDNMAWNWRNLPDHRTRFSISPHLNHRHTDEHAMTEHLWLEAHLKGAPLKIPQTPALELHLRTEDGLPKIAVQPDPSLPVQRVDVYYSVDPHALTRFWRDAGAVKNGNEWTAKCPVLTTDQPLFAFANVVYETPAAYQVSQQPAERANSPTFAISSRVLSASPSQLKAAQVKATDQPDRSIDDGSRGWHDWYRLNWGHAPLWTATTRKLKDPKWQGPDHATLTFEIRCESDNQLVITLNCNAWGAMDPRKPAVDYTVVKPLRGSKEWQPVSIALNELRSTHPTHHEPLTNWRTVTELTLSPAGPTRKGAEKADTSPKPWQGPREIRNLRWLGGTYATPPPPNASLNPDAFQKNFNDAIKKSIEQEKRDAK